MKSGFTFSARMLLMLCVSACSLLGMATPASAANLHTHAAACHNYNAAEALDIDYMPSAVRNNASQPRQIICPIVRSPLQPNAPYALFYVEGGNTSGTSTPCALYSHDYDGRLLGSTSFTGTTTNFDQQLSLPAAQAPVWAFVSMICLLPANGKGTIRGVIAAQ